MADDAITVIRTLDLERVDLLSFPMGGMIAQVIAQDQPGLVRTLILAGTGPAADCLIPRQSGRNNATAHRPDSISPFSHDWRGGKGAR